MSAGTAIVILAGGRATRFPGKLACDAGGMPVLGRVYRNALATGLPVYVAGSAPLLPPLAAELGAPLLPDRWPGGGPLRAIVSCCERLEHERVFVLAGDAPNVTGDVFDALARAWADGDDAAVPAHDGRIEPLAALYRRRAAARSGRALVGSGDESVRALAER
ncbi:MAG TPA: NTP transferase domain-containing protein, partial [Candidatus Tumulicola sp.]|nr:NTP transferase domain-containing protein [Candidatus Tumulicola sp.]